jgi:FkbM family methyltransferase
MVLSWLGISASVYLDIGANHPTDLSNTYYFYCRGWHGVCVEPNPKLAAAFRKRRRRDTVLPLAIGCKPGRTRLHLASDPGLSTTSLRQMKYLQESGTWHILGDIEVEMVSIMELINEYFRSPPAFVSLDIEGQDLEVLNSFEFDRCRPPVWCIETLALDTGRGHKVEEIAVLMRSNGYIPFADTWINTIFVDRTLWEARI